MAVGCHVAQRQTGGMPTRDPHHLDVAACRAATPHVEDNAFLVSAGSSLPTQETLSAMLGHLQRESEVGGYRAADEAVETLQRGRAALAQLVGGQAHEVALATSDTAAWTKVWFGWVLGGNIAKNSTVLVDQLSYHTHYAAIRQSQAITPFTVAVLPALPDGTTDVDRMQIPLHTSVICTTMIATHSGNINPIAAVGKICKQVGVPMFVDGCQAVGQLHVGVRELGASVFTGTGRKWLRAPRGTGMLWVAEEIIDRITPPGIDGTNSSWSTDAGIGIFPGTKRFEEFEVSVASMVGLTAAADQALRLGMQAIELRITHLADRLRNGLAKIEQVTLHDTAAQRCGIVTFSVPGFTPAEVICRAAEDRITINSSTHNWAALDMEAKGLTQICRASPHYFNTEDEIDRLIDLVHEMTQR
jgi:cysteine desulfurase / selenocysteine lyase